jgi:hypothetical protein
MNAIQVQLMIQFLLGFSQRGQPLKNGLAYLQAHGQEKIAIVG